MTNLTRRNFLNTMGQAGVVGASLAMLPGWMPRLAFANNPAQATGQVLVNVFLRGGIDGLSAVVPYTEGANYYDARPTQSVAAPGSGDAAALDLDGQFGLHPALAPLHDIYAEGDLAIVHATGLTDDTRSHFDAMLFMEYGTPGEKFTSTGWLGRHLEATAARNNSPFRAIGMGATVPDSLRGFVSPLALQSIADFHLQGREDELVRVQQALAQLYTVDAPTRPIDFQAKLVFDTIAQVEHLNALGYEPATGADYPDNDYGMGLRQVAQLIKADVGLEVACVDLGGWDTHENQGTLDGEFNYLLSALAQGLHAFYTDLNGYNDNVMVVTMSEFGRRLQENASQGTDHGHGNFMLVMGGSVNGGRVHTDWPTLAPARLSDGDLAITTDYRHVLAEVLQHHLHNPDVSTVFPNFKATPLGLVVPA